MKTEKAKEKSILFLILVTFIILGLINMASADESCYIEFILSENFVQINDTDFNITLGYSGLNNLYGDYSGYVYDYNLFEDIDYSLKLYSNSQEEIGIYVFNSGIYGLFNSSIRNIVVPFNPHIHSAKVFIGEEEKLAFSVDRISCSRTCKIRGENGTTGERCCDDYLESWFSSDGFTCVNCGDGVCSEFEDEYVCFIDCKPSVDEMNCSNGYTPSYYGCVEDDMCGNTLVEESNSEECDDGDIFDGDGCSSDCKLEKCKDYDFSDGNWENSLLNSSYVFFDFNRSEDSCKNETTVIENYCGYDFSRWDFWNWFIDKVAKQKEVDCEFGCFDGACLENPEIPAQNNITDLPEEPLKPGRL